MSRLIVALALSGLMASVATAKDLCVQLDGGLYSGSQVVLKKVKLTPGTSAPLQGYFAHYDPNSFSYSSASPIAGASVVNSSGMETALGLDLHPVSVSANGYGIGSQNTSLSIDCSAGSDGKLGVLDSCFANVGGDTTSAHVVECKDAAQIP